MKHHINYFRARWYDPITGRWLSKDPIGISGGLNQYVFVENCPIMYRDPLGLCADEGGGYFSQSWNQLIYGNLTDDVTLLGTAAQIITGLIGVDLPGDVRDISADIGGWKTSWAHAGKTGLDLVGLFPLIGAVKYADEGGSLLKGFLKGIVGYSLDKKIRVEIEEDKAVGFYVYAYLGNSKKTFADHLCDSFEEAVECTLDNYDIRMSVKND